MSQNIAGYDVCTLESGRFGLDGGAMFGIVPKPLWNRRAPADDRNRIDLATRLLLLRGHDRVILVDTGMGDKYSDKERDIYKIDQQHSSLDRSLDSHGLTADDVTDVILTHLHFDHAGGATRRGDGGNDLVPAFGKARYHVQRQNFEWGRKPSDRDRGSYLSENFDPLYDAGCLELLDGPGTIFPGIDLELVHGHTFGQQLVRVHDDDQCLLFCGDLLPTAAHLPVPYVMGYDLQPLETVKEKHALYERAVAGNWLLVLEHDPNGAAIRVRQGERGIEVAEHVDL